MRRKIIIPVILYMMFPVFVFAADNPTSNESLNNIKNSREERIASRDAKISQITDQRVSDLKERGENEIDRRITALNGLIERISKLKKITDSQKSELTNKVQDEINTLNDLKTKIDSDTDLTTLKTDVKSIVDSYRVFVIFMPEIQLIGASDRLYTLSADLTTISAKLKERINEVSGQDLTQVNQWLTDLDAKAANINSIADTVTSGALALNPQDYPDNRETIQSLRSQLKTAKSDIEAAKTDAKNIIKQLKLWSQNDKSSSESSTLEK